MLNKNQQRWGRARVLSSRRMTSGSGINWSSPPTKATPRRLSSMGGNNNNNNHHTHNSLSQLKENDDAIVVHNNTNTTTTSNNNTNRRLSSFFGKGSSPPLSSSNYKRLYINSQTKHAMQTEINNLPLPASLSTICIAIRSSNEVLTAHAGGGDSNDYYYNDGGGGNDDDAAAMRAFEIMGTHLSGLSLSSLSPTQRKNNRMEELRNACYSLVSRGSNNKHLLNDWTEVEKELSEVFNFSVIDIKYKYEVSSGFENEEEERQVIIPTLFNRRGRVVGGKAANNNNNNVSPMKVTPRRARHTSPKRSSHQHPTMKSSVSGSATRMKMKERRKAKGFLGLGAYKARIKQGLGAETFLRIFQQTEILPTQPSISSYDEVAASLDEQIQQKELELSSTKRIQEALAAKEMADKEKEAQESANKLLSPLTPDEQHIVDGATRGIGPEGEILAKQDSDSVQRGSMQTLNPGQWLNDEVINYFLKNCLAKRDEILCTKQPGRKRSHFFNSFFVQTMFDEKNNNMNVRGKYNYKNVRRWGKKVPGKDIFNLKYIICPINLDNMHWTSAVIFMEEKRIQYYDSMGGTDRVKLEGLLQYLKDEWKAKKKGGELDVSEWTLVNCTRDTPRQRNGFDCGVFTCMNCDFISKDCPLVFTQDHINLCREQIALSIMKNCAIE